MRITDIKVEEFGVWKGLGIEELPDSLVVFYGPNEAGKTTLMQFMRGALYGFAETRRQRYLQAAGGRQSGGRISVSHDSGDYLIERFACAAGSGRRGQGTADQLSIRSPQGASQGPFVLQTLLAGIDEPTFSNVFAVGLRELQELGSLNDTDAAEQLYKLTSGLDRVSLVEVMRELETSRAKTMGGFEGQASQIDQLLEQREKLRGEIEQLAGATARWSNLAVQRESIRREVDGLEQETAAAEQRARVVEVALQVRDKWIERDNLQAQVNSLRGRADGQLDQLPDQAIERLDRIQDRVEKKREQLREIRQKGRLLKEEAEQIAIDERVTSQAARIEAVLEHDEWIGALQENLERLHSSVAELESEAGQRGRQVELPGDWGSRGAPEITPAALHSLRSPARTMRAATQRLRELEEANGARVEETADGLQRLRQEMSRRPERTLGEALEHVGTLVSTLRRRSQLEQRLDQMKLHREDLQHQSYDLCEQQMLPMWVVFAFFLFCGGCFAMAAVGLFFSSYLGLADGTAGAMVVFGAAGILGAIVVKQHHEARLKRDLQECNHQLNLLKSQEEQAETQRDEVERELPSDDRPVSVRLEEAESDLHRLESLIPYDDQHTTGDYRQGQPRTELDRARDDLDKARREWRDALQLAGLPETLTPPQIKQLADGHQHVSELHRQAAVCRDEISDRQRELRSLAARVRQVFDDIHQQPRAEDLREQLKELADALLVQRQKVERREALAKRYRQIKKQYADHLRDYERLRASRRGLFAQAGVSSETQYRELADRQRSIERCLKQIGEIDTLLVAAVGSQCTDEEIGDEIAQFGAGQLEKRRQELSAEAFQRQERMAEFHQRLGELSAEMKSLTEDPRLAEARLELGCIEKRLAEQIRYWQVLAVTGILLESIRQIYETERQPQTLRAASRFLDQLTEGKYKRIWTPLGDELLRVDDQAGRTLSVDMLSRGTREAVFVSLRLALAAAYARRGVVLPLILDDVLVNFDVRRARAAIRVLRDFGNRGHQILMFTCHDHMVEMFRGEGVEVRLLPARSAAVTEASVEVLAAPPVEEPEPEVAELEDEYEYEDAADYDEEVAEDESDGEDEYEEEYEEEAGEEYDEDEYEEEEADDDEEQYEYEEEEPEEAVESTATDEYEPPEVLAPADPAPVVAVGTEYELVDEVDGEPAPSRRPSAWEEDEAEMLRSPSRVGTAWESLDSAGDAVDDEAAA